LLSNGSATGNSVIVSWLLPQARERRFRKHLLRVGKKVMYAAGQISVLIGYRYRAYSIIDGR